MLQPIAVYLLKLIICSALMVTYYWATLRNKRFHYYNRFYLLLSVIISIMIPLLNLQLVTLKSDNEQAVNVLNIIYAANGEAEVIGNGKSMFDWHQWLAVFLLLISFCMLLFVIYRISKIYRLKKHYPVNKMEEFDFINTDLQQAPFSFLKNIFWRSDISLEEATGQQILQHELTHIKQKHSWDKLFMQIVLSVFWINPFYWLIKTELYFIHEFIADEKAVENKDASAFVKADAPFRLVVDAGHGGKDDGVIGNNGVKEKDFSLMIAKKIKELSAKYGIDVVLTRDNDAFMSPPEKVDCLFLPCRPIIPVMKTHP